MSTFFDISIDHINLFSIMIGISIVSLSSFYKGRIRWTRVSFFYIASVALYYGYIKDPKLAAFENTSKDSTSSTSSTGYSEYREGTVQTASAYAGKSSSKSSSINHQKEKVNE